MQTRFFPLINRHFHIDMPYFLLLRIPCITALDVVHIKKWFADFIHATTLPRILKQYLHKILIVPLCHPHKLSQTFTQDRLQLSIADYQNYVTAHSNENNLIATGPEIVTPQHPTPLTQLLHARGSHGGQPRKEPVPQGHLQPAPKSKPRRSRTRSSRSSSKCSSSSSNSRQPCSRQHCSCSSSSSGCRWPSNNSNNNNNWHRHRYALCLPLRALSTLLRALHWM